MKKKLNTESIANELEGASLFFSKSPTPPPLPKPEKPAIEKGTSLEAGSPNLAKVESPIAQTHSEEIQDRKRSFERTTERTNVRTEVKPKREKIRHTFDVYKDQLISLQMIQLERVQAGKKKPKLGKMVSDGIDLFLKQEASKKKRA